MDVNFQYRPFILIISTKTEADKLGELDSNKNILWHSIKNEELSQSYNIYIYICIFT